MSDSGEMIGELIAGVCILGVLVAVDVFIGGWISLVVMGLVVVVLIYGVIKRQIYMNRN